MRTVICLVVSLFAYLHARSGNRLAICPDTLARLEGQKVDSEKDRGAQRWLALCFCCGLFREVPESTQRA
jgi:hypothetical protein